MEYVILIIVIAVLAVATGGWLLFVRPRGGRTLEAPKPQTPPAAQATTPAGRGDAESSAVPDTPAAAAFAALFAAGTGGGLLGPGHVMATIEVIFAVGAVLLALATLVGLRLPAGPGPS